MGAFTAIALSALMAALALGLRQNNTALLISTYAKVAHWGAARATSTTEVPNEGRSNSGQTLWTHRSDVNVVGGQNLKKKKPSGFGYHFGTSKTDEVDQGGPQLVPAKGEIQERFNPPPYFEFSPYAKLHKPQGNAQPSVVYAAPFNNKYPVYTKPQDAPAANSDTYNSPFNSYNPPAPKPDGVENDSFPPNGSPDGGPSSPSGDLYLPPPTDAPQSTSNPYSNSYQDSYKTPSKPQNPYAAPSDPYSPADQDNDSYQDAYKPQSKPHSLDDDQGPYVYLPSQENPHTKPLKGYPPPTSNGGDDGASPPINKIVDPPTPAQPPYLEHPPSGWKGDDDGGWGQPQDDAKGGGWGQPQDDAKGHSMAEEDLSPPANDQNYLDHDPKAHGYDAYSFDHGDHHVYHEVHTTEQPEDMRVNKGHYSYYYLGRKLWYIPLYFSIYFIIYVTVLILKSIARHKIEFKHKHLHDKHREARTMDVEELHRDVEAALRNASAKYDYM